MSKVEIYYFSGTGNSLHVARELQKRIPEASLIPIVSQLDKDFFETDADTIGIVFPIYMAAAPLPVRNFIQKMKLKSNQYIFAIATRIGTTHGAFTGIDKLLSKSGKSLDAYFSFNMASNDPKFNYKVPTEEEILSLEKVVHKELDSIKDILIRREKRRQKDTNYNTKVPLVGLLSALVVFTERYKDKLYADSKCIGCGTCSRVCLSGKIKMVSEKPVWQDTVKCYKCSACLNYCPVQAAQIKGYTENKGRYSHPYATINDIENQKEK